MKSSSLPHWKHSFPSSAHLLDEKPAQSLLQLGPSKMMNGARTWKRYALIGLLIFAVVTFFYQFEAPSCQNSARYSSTWNEPERFVDGELKGGKGNGLSYNRDMPLIFIGGMPRSGTTLLRVLLDAHPDIRCGEETRVIPRILGFRQQWMKAPIEAKRLEEAGITSSVLDDAVSSFILEIIVKHGRPATRLCNKDPFTLRSAVYLNQIFPNSKFIFMIRDGRAVVHSIISRKVTISGFDLTDFRQCMKKWNTAMHAMHQQCQTLGDKVCLPVHYEQLVLHPSQWMHKILQFLDVKWNDSVLHHEQLVDRPDGISLSKLERSTDQVIKPINIEALSKWVGHIPSDVVESMGEIAPMLHELGYDPRGNPPDYGKPDSFVLKKMETIESARDEYSQKEKEIIQIRESMRAKLRANANPNSKAAPDLSTD